jgi:Flp pilus assembly protein TadG
VAERDEVEVPARRRDDRGAATAFSMFLAVPFLILFTFSALQIVFVWHAANILNAVAEEAARHGALEGATCAEAEQLATDWANRLGGNWLQNTSVNCRDDGGDAVVTVTGNALPVVANWHVHVTKRYRYPLEPGR